MKKSITSKIITSLCLPLFILSIEKFDEMKEKIKDEPDRYRLSLKSITEDNPLLVLKSNNQLDSKPFFFNSKNWNLTFYYVDNKPGRCGYEIKYESQEETNLILKNTSPSKQRLEKGDLLKYLKKGNNDMFIEILLGEKNDIFCKKENLGVFYGINKIKKFLKMLKPDNFRKKDNDYSFILYLSFFRYKFDNLKLEELRKLSFFSKTKAEKKMEVFFKKLDEENLFALNNDEDVNTKVLQIQMQFQDFKSKLNEFCLEYDLYEGIFRYKINEKQKVLSAIWFDILKTFLDSVQIKFEKKP